MPVIAILGTFDTKGPEHAALAEMIRGDGFETLLIDVGTGGEPSIIPDFPAAEVAEAGGEDWRAAFARKDRGECVALMARAAPVLLAKLAAEGRIHGVISLGGGGGTAIATAAMRALPIGFPKIMVSTMASGNVAHYLGSSDIVIMPAIVDVSGLNRISRLIFENAAGAIRGMVAAAGARKDRAVEDRPLVVASMFGNTTACVEAARGILEAAGYEVLVFHATGAGGRAMEALIASGLIAGVLDITTTEWADELAGGVLSAGPDRLDAAGKAAVPAIVAPGCLDMVNFAAPETVPAKYAGRNLYRHNPQVTLMRTNAAESAELGKILAEKLNRYPAPLTVLLPLRGLSLIGAAGQPFHDSEADRALFGSMKSRLRPGIMIREVDSTINDPAFARACAESLLENIRAAADETGSDRRHNRV
jgi:uncharacterized protein (UPF0261 family)